MFCRKKSGDGSDDDWQTKKPKDWTCEQTGPPGRCRFDPNFLRYCDANGGWHKMLFSVSAEECLRKCSEDYPECKRAPHHPGNQIWPSDDRTNCWLWSDKALPCPWGDGALGPAHPGATMIECDDSKFLVRNKTDRVKIYIFSSAPMPSF